MVFQKGRINSVGLANPTFDGESCNTSIGGQRFRRSHGSLCTLISADHFRVNKFCDEVLEKVCEIGAKSAPNTLPVSHYFEL